MKRTRWSMIGWWACLVMAMSVFLSFWPLTGIQFQYGFRCFTASAMHDAVCRGDLACVKRIVARHPDMVDCKVRGIKGNSRTALYTAIVHNHTDTADFLLDHGADTSVGNPLNAAVRKGDERMVRHLAAHGAELNPLRGSSPLETARQSTNWRMYRLLRELGANNVPPR